MSDQLKKCYAQLRETKSLFEREQELNNQLQNAAKQLEEEKSAMSISNQQKDDEIAELKAELLKLQANQERDKSLIEQQNQKQLENNNIIDNFDSEIKGLKDSIASLETEKDDMQNQVLVLTEERDAARTQEEDLFEKLNERTNDLERLQESYVDINDRCNDAQDELADLRDKLEYYQQALATRAELLSAPTSVGNSFDYGSNSKANIESVRPSSSGGVVNDKKVLKSTSVASTRSEENLKLSSEELNVNNNNSSSGIAMKTETNDEDDYYDDYEDEFED